MEIISIGSILALGLSVIGFVGTLIKIFINIYNMEPKNSDKTD